MPRRAPRVAREPTPFVHTRRHLRGADTFLGWLQVNAQAMFNEVDVDKNGEVSKDEWLEFWQNVLKSNYTVRAAPSALAPKLERQPSR